MKLTLSQCLLVYDHFTKLSCYLQTAAAARERREQAAKANGTEVRDPSPSQFDPMMDDIMDDDSPTQTLRKGSAQKTPARANRNGKHAAQPQTRGNAHAGPSTENRGSDTEMDAGGDAEPTFAVHSNKKRKSAAETRNDLVDIMHGRTTMLERLTQAVANNNRPVNEPANDDAAAIDQWSRMIAHDVKAMHPRAARHFMLRVHTMATEELDDMEM